METVFVADFFEIRFIGKREFSLGNFIAGVDGIAFFAGRIGVQQNDHNFAAVISVDNAADGDNAMIGGQAAAAVNAAPERIFRGNFYAGGAFDAFTGMKGYRLFQSGADVKAGCVGRGISQIAGNVFIVGKFGVVNRESFNFDRHCFFSFRLICLVRF